MEEFKMCSDGKFMPVSLPCPPPYSGPFYYYPYENIPIPPARGSSNYESNGGGGRGTPISATAVAGILTMMGIILMVCLLAIRFRTRLLGGSLALHQGGGEVAELESSNSGDVLLDVDGGGLEKKLVNLLPMFEYVKFQDDGKEFLDVRQKPRRSSSCTSECAVCLSLFEEKDILRILPKCKHIFHLLCIDKWFESHANCPLCRERITPQTIRPCLMKSEDRAIDIDDHQQPCLNVVDDHHQQLAEFDACPNTPNHLNNQQDPAPHHSCPPLENQIDTPPSATSHVDGHHATKPNQNTDLADEQEHGHSTELTSALLKDHYSYHHQSFSFPTYPKAQIDEKEMSCLVHHANYEVARSPPLSIESNQPGVFTYRKIIRSYSQRFGEGNDNSPIAALVVMSSPYDSACRLLPELLKRSHSAGSLIEHYPTSTLSDIPVKKY